MHEVVAMVQTGKKWFTTLAHPRTPLYLFYYNHLQVAIAVITTRRRFIKLFCLCVTFKLYHHAKGFGHERIKSCCCGTWCWDIKNTEHETTNIHAPLPRPARYHTSAKHVVLWIGMDFCSMDSNYYYGATTRNRSIKTISFSRWLWHQLWIRSLCFCSMVSKGLLKKPW